MTSNPVINPIFIVGYPRSGTTLVRSILSAHPRIVVGPELHFFNWVQSYDDVDLNDPHNFDRFWELLTSDIRFSHLDLDSDAAKKEIQKRERVDFKTVFSSLLEQYAARVGKPRWGEKTPTNYLHLRTLLHWYPQARIIFVIRDPRAVCISLMKTPWGAKPLEDHLVNWNLSVKILQKWQRDPRICAIRYESLVSDPPTAVRTLCAFLREDYWESMIHKRGESVALENRTGWAKKALEAAMEPIHTTSVHEWHQQLTPTQISLIEYITRSHMTEYGYASVGKPLDWHGQLHFFKWRARTAPMRLRTASIQVAKYLLRQLRLMGAISSWRLMCATNLRVRSALQGRRLR